MLYVTNNLYLLDQQARTLYHEYTNYTLLSILKIFFILIKVVWKLEETKKYYTMYNTLHTTLKLLQKEVNKSFIILSIQWFFWLLNIFDFDSFFLNSFETNNCFDLDCSPSDVLATFGDEFLFFLPHLFFASARLNSLSLSTFFPFFISIFHYFLTFWSDDFLFTCFRP